MTNQNIQIIKESEKGPDFSGSAPVTWIGTLTSASLNISADSNLVIIQFNDLIVSPTNTKTWQGDVTSHVLQGDNFLSVKIDYGILDQLVSDTKNVNAVLTVNFSGLGGGISTGWLEDLWSKLMMNFQTLGSYAEYIVIAVIVIAVIIAVAYLIESAYGHKALPSF